MPIYVYGCGRCSFIIEKLQQMDGESPQCLKCGAEMLRKPTYPVMVKVKGSGGYPSRMKQIRNTPHPRSY